MEFVIWSLFARSAHAWDLFLQCRFLSQLHVFDRSTQWFLCSLEMWQRTAHGGIGWAQWKCSFCCASTISEPSELFLMACACLGWDDCKSMITAFSVFPVVWKCDFWKHTVKWHGYCRNGLSAVRAQSLSHRCCLSWHLVSFHGTGGLLLSWFMNLMSWHNGKIFCYGWFSFVSQC